MIWKIFATACMISNPSNCWQWESPKPFPTYAACAKILNRPYSYVYTPDYPMKVEGAVWTEGPICKPEERK